MRIAVAGAGCLAGGVPGGFFWQDRTYLSLSAIARALTGTAWNGPRFFGLRVPGNPEARAATASREPLRTEPKRVHRCA